MANALQIGNLAFSLLGNLAFSRIGNLAFSLVASPMRDNLRIGNRAGAAPAMRAGFRISVARRGHIARCAAVSNSTISMSQLSKG